MPLALMIPDCTYVINTSPTAARANAEMTKYPGMFLLPSNAGVHARRQASRATPG
jgi:hypothetical protein